MVLVRASIPLAVVAALAVATPGAAAVFADRPSFLDATSALTTIDFNNTAPAYGVTDFAGLYKINGASFSHYKLFSISPEYARQHTSLAVANGYGSDFLEWEGDTPYTLSITLPSAVTAVGLDFADIYGGVATFSIGVGASTYQPSSALNATSFFGVTTTTPFTMVTVYAPTSANLHAIYPTLDNFSFGAGVPAPAPAPTTIPTTVPEPAAAALVLIALAGLGLGRGGPAPARVRAARR